MEMTKALAWNEAEAQAEIARLIQQCAAGLGDAEADAIGIARRFGFDEAEIRRGFVAARQVAKPEPKHVVVPIGFRRRDADIAAYQKRLAEKEAADAQA